MIILLHSLRWLLFNSKKKRTKSLPASSVIKRDFRLVVVTVIVSMTATAARTTAAFFQVFFSRNASEFQGLGDVLGHRLVNVVQFFLRVHETHRNWILQQGIAIFFERRNFIG